jgi:hypothetical protein
MCAMQAPPSSFTPVRPNRASGRAFFRLPISRLPFFLTLAFLLPAAAFSQGFGTIRGDKVVLHRKLPAVIHLTGTSISVKTTAHTAQQNDTAQLLTELLQTNLMKYDKTLTVDENSPNVKIQCTITNFEIPAPQQYTKDDTILVKGKPTLKKEIYYHVVGTLDVDVRVTDRGGKTLDSNTFSAKYAQEYEQPDQQGGVAVGAVVGAFNSVKNKVKPGEEAAAAPTTAVQLQQLLIRKMVDLITPRIVNTDEPVEIPLAKGKMDEADKFATGGLWSRDLETLETMPPLPKPEDDAYRFYDIGVANEALGYQAEDHAAAKNFLMEAAVNYGKAIDGKPTEKNFIDAQTRIELAVAYYKSLSAPAPKAVVADNAPPLVTTPTSPAGASTPKTTTKNVSAKPATPKAPSATTPPKTAPPNTAPVTPPKPAVPALTNAKVIEMFKGGVDEPTIIAAIHDAHSTQFDLSADGLIDLAKNGVKGKIVDAMRTRVRASSASHTSNGGA